MINLSWTLTLELANVDVCLNAARSASQLAVSWLASFARAEPLLTFGLTVFRTEEKFPCLYDNYRKHWRDLVRGRYVQGEYVHITI